MHTLSLRLLALTSFCSVLALSANAAPPHVPGSGPALGALPPRLGELATERQANIDSNHDGKISLEEFLAPRLARLDEMLARLDTNGDGLLSEAEVHAAAATAPNQPLPPKQRTPPVPPAVDRAAVIACMKSSNPDFDPPEVPDPQAIADRFAKADTNGDGKLSLAELSAAVTARATAQFKRLDQDGDGFITAADRKANQAERAALAQSLRACVKTPK